MTESQGGNESLCLDGQALGHLQFEWREDRYEHCWNFDNDVALRSVESKSDQAWPLSPPLQQIHQQSFEDGRQIIFGVGMSGRGHWSASFTLVPELKCWIVELACKAPVVAERLLSTYACDQAWTQKSDSCFGLEGTNITLEAISPSTQAKLESQQLSLSPIATASVESASQWAFRLRA